MTFDIRSAEYLFVSDGFELFLEVGRQIRQRLVEAAGGVVEEVAQQQFRGRIGTGSVPRSFLLNGDRVQGIEEGLVGLPEKDFVSDQFLVAERAIVEQNLYITTSEKTAIERRDVCVITPISCGHSEIIHLNDGVRSVAS